MKQTILIAEDDADIRALLKLYLESEGYAVIEAEDGAAALAKAREHTPDMAILDVMMPRMNGFELTRALRKRIAWCWSIRPRIAPPDAKRHTVMADGTYMGHGWCLIIAIDGESGEVLAFQWRAYEELRRCCRRLEKLFREGKSSSPFPGRRLPQVGRWRAPRTGWRAASTRSSRTYCATIAGCPRSTCAARANGYAT